MKKITHIDCTFRDGGYYNSWYFEESLVKNYLETINDLKIDYIEIGFRFLKDTNNLGPFASSKEKFLRKLKIDKNLKLAVMINIGEFSKNHIFKELNSLFVKKKKSLITLVRIASHINEIDLAILASKILKKKGYKVAVNLMQISEIKKSQLMNFLNIVNKNKSYIDVFYFADSIGALEKKDVIELCKTIKKFWKKPFGIHAHDNFNLALDNSVTALKSGASYVDSTVLGMGRGPGNARTELLCSYLNSIRIKKYNLLTLAHLVDNDFLLLKNKFNWGPNIYYYLSAKHGIHPTYIQTLLSEKRYRASEIVLAINNLKKIQCKKYNPLILKNAKIFIKEKKNYLNIKNPFKNKNILILANGKTLETHKKKIFKYIKEKKPTIISLNTIRNGEFEKLVRFIAICHPSRIIFETKIISKKNTTLVTPFHSFDTDLKKYLKPFKKIEYGLKINEYKTNIFQNYCELKKILVLPYILSLLSVSLVKSIKFGGLDGGNIKRNELKENIKIINYFKKNKKLSIDFLTPSYF